MQDKADEKLTPAEALKDPRFKPDEFRAELKRQGFRRKASMKNQPCFCGSGKKTKNCHWSLLPR